MWSGWRIEKVLQDLWNQHNEFHALPHDTSPITGLFEDAKRTPSSARAAEAAQVAVMGVDRLSAPAPHKA